MFNPSVILCNNVLVHAVTANLIIQTGFLFLSPFVEKYV